MRALAYTFLFMIIAAFGWIGASPWLHESAPPAAAPRAERLVTKTSAAFIAETPAGATDLAPFTARPLFSAVRRPPPPEAPGIVIEEPANDLLFGRYEIAGVVMLGARSLALLRDRDGALLRLRVGDMVPAEKSGGSAAELTEITFDSLTFRHDGASSTAPIGQKESNRE